MHQHHIDSVNELEFVARRKPVLNAIKRFDIRAHFVVLVNFNSLFSNQSLYEVERNRMVMGDCFNLQNRCISVYSFN